MRVQSQSPDEMSGTQEGITLTPDCPSVLLETGNIPTAPGWEKKKKKETAQRVPAAVNCTTFLLHWFDIEKKCKGHEKTLETH